jgi:hypothetical protein
MSSAVYIETSIISYLTSWQCRDLVAAIRQAIKTSDASALCSPEELGGTDYAE